MGTMATRRPPRDGTLVLLAHIGGGVGGTRGGNGKKLKTRRSPTKLAADMTLDEWALSQVATSVDWLPASLLCAVCSGGLNLQAEHHLFPSLSHLELYHCRATIGRCVEEATGRPITCGTISDALAWHMSFLHAPRRAARRHHDADVST